MRIISSISDDPAGEVGYAVIDITPELARHFLDLREKCKSVFDLKGIYGVTVRDYTPTLYYRSSKDSKFLKSIREEGNWQEAPEGWVCKGDEFGTSTSMLTIKPGSIIWHFSEKHSGATIETSNIGWETIEEIAKATEGTSAAKNG